MEEHHKLIQAASSGDVQEVRRLQAQLIGQEQLESYGESRTIYKALQYAARNGHVSTITKLLDKVSRDLWCFFETNAKEDEDLEQKDYAKKGRWYFYGAKMMESPLHLAVKEGHLQVVQQILQFFRDKQLLNNIDECESYIYQSKRITRANIVRWFDCLVEWAVRWGHAGIVELLLTPPFLIPSVHKKELPVHLAAHSKHLDVLKQLLEAEARSPGNFHVKQFSEDGLTALHLAAQSGSSSIVDFLLASGRNDANERSDPDFFTPLHLAANSGRVEVVRLLLQSLIQAESGVVSYRQVDLLAKDRMGRTALHYAAREGHQHVVQLLLDCGKESGIAGLPDHDGLLPLHMAARAGNVEVINSLICHHVGGLNSLARHRLEMRSCFEEEFIHKFDYNLDSTASVHIAKFPRPNQVDSLFWKTEGFTPLHFAARYGHEAAVRELVNGKTQPDNLHLEDHAGFLAFDWMEVQGKGALFLKCVEDAYDSAAVDALQRASSTCKMTNKTRSRIAADIHEEKKAMDELQYVTQWRVSGQSSAPPFSMCVLRWLMQEPADSKWNEFVMIGERSMRTYKDAVSATGNALRLALRKPRNERLARHILLLLDDELMEYFIMLVLEWFCWREPLREPYDELIECVSLLPRKVIFARGRDVDAVSESLKWALIQRRFQLAKKILLLLDPKVVLNHNVTEVIELWTLGMPIQQDLVEVGQVEFLIEFVKQHGGTNLLRQMLPWAKERGRVYGELVEVILEKPELKRALYEDRQVYLDCANAILVGATLIAGVAFSAWLQPPRGYSHEYAGREYAVAHERAARSFWGFINAAFFSSVAALTAGAKGALPVVHETQITESVEKVKRAVAVASTLLAVALVCLVGAFIEAGLTALAPIHSQLKIIYISAVCGCLVCGPTLFWFSRSVLPLIKRERERDRERQEREREKKSKRECMHTQGREHEVESIWMNDVCLQ